MKALAIALATLATGIVLAACGGSGGQIPATNAATLQTDLNDVEQNMLIQNCAETRRALNQTQTDLGRLPSSVDQSLRANLQKGLDTVRPRALKECQPAPTQPTPPTGPTAATGPTGSTGTSSSTSSTSTSSTSTSTATSSASSTASGATTPTGSTTGGTPAGDTTTTSSSSAASGLGGLGGPGNGGAASGGQ